MIIHTMRRDLDKYLGKLYTATKMKIYNKNDILINLSFLIRRELKNDFVQSFNERKGRYPECKFMLSGPWPPKKAIL